MQLHSSDRPFHWAVIGTGFIFPKHKEAIEANGGKIVAAYNTKNDWRDVLKTDVPYVAVCTPNDLHYEMSKACLEAGKTVLCEKPLMVNNIGHLEELKRYPNLYVVLQLRWHPQLLAVKKWADENTHKRHRVILDIYINRDEKVVAPWKFDERRSGGILYNIGAHYFDVLTYLFGNKFELGEVRYSQKKANGHIQFLNADVRWSLDITAQREDQRRVVKINGKEINFSSKDNLAYENLHYYVYKSIKKGDGVRVVDCEPSLRLISTIRKKAKVPEEILV